MVQNHFKYRKLFKVPELTNSQILLRYNFAFLLYQNDFDFKNENLARFSFRPDNCKWWVKDDDMSENATTCIRKYPFSTLIWAAIGRNYKSELMFVDKSVNAQRYKRLLMESKIFSELNKKEKPFNFLFQQDGATYHWTPLVMKYICRYARFLNGWLPNSPDISPIENLWTIMENLDI